MTRIPSRVWFITNQVALVELRQILNQDRAESLRLTADSAHSDQGLLLEQGFVVLKIRLKRISPGEFVGKRINKDGTNDTNEL
ncbi:hypothetical protein NDU88_004038 [Pleurodeles waltl]|uniref:Uncharacterized protein n=1 Tax=Pleurodeles waltl TaxID=8319 RepID=A0AAV7V089_PLEWA|nr:hypothetical protein NDU88_004038 [Pleurodeles waltl]